MCCSSTLLGPRYSVFIESYSRFRTRFRTQQSWSESAQSSSHLGRRRHGRASGSLPPPEPVGLRSWASPTDGRTGAPQQPPAAGPHCSTSDNNGPIHPSTMGRERTRTCGRPPRATVRLKSVSASASASDRVTRAEAHTLGVRRRRRAMRMRVRYIISFFVFLGGRLRLGRIVSYCYMCG